MRSRHTIPHHETSSSLPHRHPHDDPPPPSGGEAKHHHAPHTAEDRIIQAASGVTPLALTFFSGCIVTLLLFKAPYTFTKLFQLGVSSNNDCQIQLGTSYKGKEYRTTDTVGAPKCLVESKFLKVQQHQVRLSSQSSSHVIIPDWIWIDYHERINVLVQQAPKNSIETNNNHNNERKNKVNDNERKNNDNDNDEPRFLVFEQTKYALEGRMSLAIVGGIVEPGGESPEEAARREVQEEMKMNCQSFSFLGRYRTDVNRGMGWTNAYLASDCTKIGSANENTSLEEKEKGQVGAADTERMDLKTMTLTELRQAVQAGKFLEIQWTATVSLAILQLDHRLSAHL